MVTQNNTETQSVSQLINLNVTIPAVASKSYPILISNGLLNEITLWDIDFSKFQHIIVITDKTVGELYGRELVTELRNIVELRNIHSVMLLEIEGGEDSKIAATKSMLEDEMLQHNVGRNTLCIALGGGVVGDMAGFVASTYMRGISYIQIPTTLLAMVDSSIGGKTAINTKYGKNLIGAFWQPKAVIMDLNCLNSLPKEHLIAGLVEAIKVFLTSNAVMFDYVKNHIPEILNYDKNVLQHIISEAVKLKAHIVELDEKEENQRMTLNFGHTIGHGLELVADYKLLHGYAVAFGVIIEAKIAVAMGELSTTVVAEIIELFTRLCIIDELNNVLFKIFGINIMDGSQDMSRHMELNDAILAALLHDKKNKNGQIYCVLLKQIGEVSCIKNSDITKDDLVATAVPVEIIRQSLCLS